MTADPKIRRARADEAGFLTSLAMRAKAHWGYDDAFMEACRQELTVRPERIRDGEIWVAERAGVPVGLLEVILEDGMAEVYLCFVEPAAIGTGVGRALWAKAEAIAREAGTGLMGVDADPFAEGFYQAMGAVRVGEAPSGSISGRLLPRLMKRLG